MTASSNNRLAINVVELNPHAPRPFAFTELALCLRDAIRAAGFASEVHINRTDPHALSMVLGAVPPLLGPLAQLDPRRTIIVNLEQLTSTSAIAAAPYRLWLRQWLVADYHSVNVELLQRESGGLQQVLELPVIPGPSVNFQLDAPVEKTVDVLFYGTPSARRHRVIAQLRDAGLVVETVEGAYAQELTPAMRRARLVLHVHFYESALFPVVRFLQPVASGVPVVCESSVFSALSDWSQSGILFAPYEDLVDACKALLASESEQQERVVRSQRFAEQLDFATPFNQLLQAVATRW